MKRKQIKSKHSEQKMNNIEQSENPKDRISISGMRFPISTESDWIEIKNLGKIHSSEYTWFMEKYFECAFSGAWAHKKDGVTTCDGFLVKRSVLEEKGYVYCEYTGLAEVKDGMVEAISPSDRKKTIAIPSRLVSEGLFFRDEITNSYNERSERVRILSNDTAKPSIFVSHDTLIKNKGKLFKECPCLGNWWFAEQVVKRPDLDNAEMCDKHYLSIIRKNAIREYNFKGYPSPIYTPVERRLEDHNKKLISKYMKDHGVSEISPIILYGIECETELWLNHVKKDGKDRFSIANDIKKSLGTDFLVIKEDGTLITNGKYSDPGNIYAGFEIVTAPADLDAHRKRWAPMEGEPWHKYMRAWQTDTCGMHIHVSRSALNEMIISRIVYFVNHDNNKAFIKKVAGRSEEKFTRYYPKKITDGFHPERCGNLEDPNHARRVAVNLENPKTIEFRIFRGTMRYCHIIRNLEFVDAVVHFCQPCQRPFKDMDSYKNLIEYVAVNRKRWPELYRWFDLHGMIPNHLMPRVKPFNPKDKRGTKPHEVVEHEFLPEVKKEKVSKFKLPDHAPQNTITNTLAESPLNWTTAQLANGAMGIQLANNLQVVAGSITQGNPLLDHLADALDTLDDDDDTEEDDGDEF